MNKAEIKQIILEEIKAAISEQTEDERIAQAMETGDEEELENLAAGALDRAEQEVIDTLTKDYEGDIDDEDIAAISKDWNDEQDAMFGKPSFVEEDESLEEMARTSNVFKLKGNHTYDEVLRFMERVNNILKSYKTPGQKRPKKRFSAEDMKKVATALTSSSGFTSKDIRLAVDAYNSPAQANKFIKALEMKGYIELTSQLKKAMKPERDPNAPETRGRKAKSAEFDVADDPTAMDFGDFEDLDLSGFDDIYENNTTMTNLEKYIKQQIKEAKNPLAKKMKEIENQGRIAALETKLAAVAEMIEETNARLTRIDEDEEFTEMMDKNAVKEVRKQLKELERAQAKLQKEYDKVSEGRKRKTVVDEEEKSFDEKTPEEMSPEDTKNLALSQAGIPEEIELEEDNFALNESVKRMQKLANLKG